MTAFASVRRDISFGPNSAYSSIHGVKIVVNGMIMMLVVNLEDRLGIGQEKSDQQINQLRTNKFIVSPIISPTIFIPDQLLNNFKLPSDINPEFHIIPRRSHWRAHYV